MNIANLKQRQQVKDTRTGQLWQVSKRWTGIYLIDPTTKETKFKLTYLGSQEDIKWLEAV